MLVLKALVWVVIVLVHGTVTVLAPYLLLRANIELFSGGLAVLRWSGLPPVFVGVLILLWSGWHLTLAGEGTPAPFDPPKRLVAKGLYRVVRNPIYVGDLLVLAGEALLFESMILLVYAVLLFCVFHLFVVFHEEPALRRKFAEPYDRYCRVVPRWIPSFPLAGVAAEAALPTLPALEPPQQDCKGESQ